VRPIIGVDIGGTFTDCIVVTPDGAVTIGKALSTGPEFDDGFINAVAAAAARLGLDLEELVSSAEGIYHGCTVGTNAMVEGRTAKVALLTTRGHRDVLASMPASAIADAGVHRARLGADQARSAGATVADLRGRRAGRARR